MSSINKQTSSIKNKWHFNGNNYILHRNGYGISFNPDMGNDEIIKLAEMINNRLLALIGEPPKKMREGAETALIKDGKFYILKGDFRSIYEKLKTFDECYAFFKVNKKLKSDYSD